MKRGSIYIIHNGCALCRYVEDDKFETLCLDNNDNIVGRGVFTKSVTPPLLWPTPPSERRRTFIPGEHINVICNGTYTLYESNMIFVEMLNGGNCLVKLKYCTSYSIRLKRVRPAKYRECTDNCKKALLYWLLMAKELRLPRDMRRLIGEYIWETRDAMEWENQE